MQAYSNAHGVNPSADRQEWVVLLSPDTRRMMSTLEVRAEVAAGTLARETLVWRAGMNEWVAIARIGELDVPVAPPPPSVSWDDPTGHHRSVGHGQAHAHGGHQHASAPNPQLTQELVTTGAVAVIMVTMTLYLLSLGGAFASGGGPGGAAHAESASNATAQKH